MGGVTNHIKAFKLHLLKDQGNFLLKALKFKHLKYAGENTVLADLLWENAMLLDAGGEVGGEIFHD